MKRTVTLTLILALSAASGLSLAQSGGMKNMDIKGMEMDKKGQATAHKAVGVVKTADPAKGTATISHEPVKSLKWPAMTMDFAVRDKQALAKLKSGQKVEFKVIEQPKGQYLITEITPAK